MHRLICLVFLAFFAGTSAAAQTTLPKCPIQSAVGEALSKLEIDVIFKRASLSEEWRKKLKEANHSDSMTCLEVSRAMLDLASENLRLEDEIEMLKTEISNLRSRVEQ